jgi:cytochrome P450
VTLTLAELEADPHATFARLRGTEPVAWVDGLEGWIVTRRDLALAVMRDARTYTVDDPRFTTSRVIGASMLSRDGGEHARHRAPFARPFRLAEVRERFTAFVAEETDRLLDGLAPAGEAELRRAFAGPLAAATTTHALGLDSADTAAVLRWYDAIVGAVTEITAGRALPDSGRAGFTSLASAIEEVLDRRETASLLGAVASDAGGLARDEVVSNAAVLLFGGIETTEGMIANAVLHLLEHPDQRALVEADRALLGGAVEESLRLEPAAAVVDRYATRDTRLGEATIAAGDLVVVSIAAANRDPASFAEPDRFDVRRANARQHLAFAGGPHVCIGMHLARLEAHMALGRVLDRLRGLALTDPADAQPRGFVFRKPRSLRVRWHIGG